MIRPTFFQESRAILRDDLQRLRGDFHTPPRASIVAPVNALKVLLAVKIRMFIHHANCWYKRVSLGLPTSRGSNYAIRRKSILELFAQGHLHYDIHVEPVLRTMGGEIAYSGAPDYVVFTSGRFFFKSGKELFTYLTWLGGDLLSVRPTKPATLYDRPVR